LPRCAGPKTFGEAYAPHGLARGRFGCRTGDPESSCTTCASGVDVVLTNGRSGDEPGAVQVSIAAAENADGQGRKPTTQLLRPRGHAMPDPRDAEVGDFNGDGKDDVAAIFAAPAELVIWLGAENAALAEASQKLALDDCPAAQLAVADGDADGTDEVILICSPRTSPVLRHCVPQLTSQP
jgi:hypothetical protein